MSRLPFLPKEKDWLRIAEIIDEEQRSKRMKRRKELEYGWIFKGSFFVQAYTVKLENGKTYVVYAHDFNDMEFFLSKLSVDEAPIKYRGTDSDFVDKKACLSYIPNKKGEPKAKPFWYRGRVYELRGVEE